LRPDITVRSEIAPDLWNFNADPEELYFALLNLCRNSADAMPHGGVITVVARNVEPSSGAARGFVEIIVADNGEGMPEEVLSQAFNPYFSTKTAGCGSGLGLPQVQRFAVGRDGAVSIESNLGAGTLVRLFLPRVHAVGLPSTIIGTEIADTLSSTVAYSVNPTTAALTS
jgi:signal transduction histidine kinase